MLAFAADGFMRFAWIARAYPRPALAAAMLALLLALSAEEDYVQLGNYARRLNYVSDSLTAGIHVIARRVQASAPGRTLIATIDGDTHFAVAWYLSQNPILSKIPPASAIHSPLAHAPWKNGKSEHADEMLLRLSRQSPDAHVYFFTYFPDTNPDVRDALASLRAQNVANIQKIFQKEIIITVWEIPPSHDN
jgi:hypothetical protein